MGLHCTAFVGSAVMRNMSDLPFQGRSFYTTPVRLTVYSQGDKTWST